MKTFVSYCRAQGDWVWDHLVPILKAVGAEVLIDRERFKAGKAVYQQMDVTQDQARVHVLVLSRAYLASKACRHEMARAIRTDPRFRTGTVVPVVTEDCELPPEITKPDPLYVDLRNPMQPDPWRLLLQPHGADLGVSVPAWLAARDDVVRFLGRNQSVNLVTSGRTIRWRELIDHVVRDFYPKMAVVDLHDPATISRHGLVRELLTKLGARPEVPREPEDLAELARVLGDLRPVQIAMRHFDEVRQRPYGVDFFSTLRWLVMEPPRPLVLLVQSYTPFGALLPRDHPLSAIDIKTVELTGSP
jgi:hypothetical protein